MTAPSTKSLFRAIKPKTPPGALFGDDLPEQLKPEQARDPLDYDPTPPSATAAFLGAEADHIRKHSNLIWESAVGGGHMAHEMTRWGFDVVGSDVMHRGYPGTILRNFYDWSGLWENMARPPSSVIVSNPPYNEINARDGHGRWLRHSLSLGCGYVAYLLNADWPAARINGMDELLRNHPPSIEYLCCWKIDFRGAGSPPQRNSFFVWDVNRPPSEPNQWIRRRLYREVAVPQQGELL